MHCKKITRLLDRSDRILINFSFSTSQKFAPLSIEEEHFLTQLNARFPETILVVGLVGKLVKSDRLCRK
ncbi:hypothetical protein NDI37_22495 [Funiculus sociatus GB2-A5]|uniref:Uncharacterized protein n=1 Tax=Funiculus sociatus GB2-A5 TaxID=2933946 RepID=A0ABV0JUS5_9CYAN|nr:MULTISPECIES: hypothetical protein [unclassified Trichocoleus]MBD1906618.1 hypothetical protein [Trichocoleus sp. FACHB-832]MBD2061521.1 hypothetical protein [Trichocoleus sp. FACHB-6]